jgi:lauroyl/myristoyl acyltransferase
MRRRTNGSSPAQRSSTYGLKYLVRMADAKLSTDITQTSGDAPSDSEALPLLAGNDLLWFLYLYPLSVLSAFDPRILIHLIGRLAEPFVQFRARKRREMVMRRVLAAQGAGMMRDQAPRIARQFIANSTFRMLDDLVLFQSRAPHKLRCSMEGIEHLERGKAAGKGVIVLTAHFCAGRAGKRYLATIGYPMLSVRDQTPRLEWGGRLGRRILEPRRMELLHALTGEAVYVEDPGSVLKIFRRLRSGGLVNIYFDGQSGTRTTPWPFLGLPRHFTTGIFDLVRLSGCAVVPMLCLGRSTSLRVILSPMLEIVKAPGREEFIHANLPTFVQTIERQIRDHPGEWEQWASF